MKNDSHVDETHSIHPAVLQACEAIGSLMELWGFKRVHGMLWTYIFLQPAPVTANQIREALGISSGLVSMTLADLERWDVVHRRSPRGDRRDYFTAEAEIWKPILRVLREREYAQMLQALETLKQLRMALEQESDDTAQIAASQLGGLIQLGDMALSLFGQFLDLGALVMRDMPSLALASGMGRTLLALRKFLARDADDSTEP